VVEKRVARIIAPVQTSVGNTNTEPSAENDYYDKKHDEHPPRT
jgi:hypothetical protein